MTSIDGAAITFDGVGKQFGDTWAVRGLDLEIPPGSIVGLIGPSGCGKTTTVRLTTGVYRPDEGAVTLLGEPPHELPSSERVTIGYLPQEPVLFEELSLWENLNFLASLSGVKLIRGDRLHELLELVDLEGQEKKLVRESSGGMKRRLALAATMAHRPPILMLDEPTAGIDPILRRRFWDHFRTLREDGRTLVVATQYVGEAVDCDHVVLLAEGRVVASGTPDDLRRTAYGGDLIEVETEAAFASTTFETLRRVEGVRSVSSMTTNRVRLVVDDGGVAMPEILQVVERAGQAIVDSEEVAVDYDDVFVRLVERHSAGDHANGEAVPA